MTRLRQVAMARGPLPVRSCEASSAKVVSLTWCSAVNPLIRFHAEALEPGFPPRRQGRLDQGPSGVGQKRAKRTAGPARQEATKFAYSPNLSKKDNEQSRLLELTCANALSGRCRFFS